MRKWKTASGHDASSPALKCVAPDDPNVWSKVENFWPTGRGSYATCDATTSSKNLTATGEGAGTVQHAFVASTLSATISYVVGAKIWEASSGGTTITDRTNSRTIGSFPFMTQFGNATICAMGSSTNTVIATGGNFTDLAGAPDAEIVIVVAGAVLAFNTDASADGWAASDVGDHTNWTTGESASGRLLQTSGPILAATAYRDQAYVFKQRGVYKGRYVGGEVKWAWEVIHWDVGVIGGTIGVAAKYAAVTCKTGIAFVGSSPADGTGTRVYYTDCVNPPVNLNPETALLHSTEGTRVELVYDTDHDLLVIGLYMTGGEEYCYSFADDAWGRSKFSTYSAGVATSVGIPIYVLGDSGARKTHFGNNQDRSPRPAFWVSAVDNLKLYEGRRGGSAAWAGSLETSKIGKPNHTTRISRATPLLRYREIYSLGSPSAALSVVRYDERHDKASTGTTAITESTAYDRFDCTSAPGAPWLKLVYSFVDTRIDVDDIDTVLQYAGVH